MRLCSIINVWACCIELLPFCIKNHLAFSDGVIVLWSQTSNHGQKSDACLEYILANGHDSRVEFIQLEPMNGVKPLVNETRKRNHGIDIARQKRFTHFMVCDADEFYLPEEIEKDKLKFQDSKLNGLVSGLFVYISKPTLYTNDHTLVPTIHRMTKDVYVGNFRDYPFAHYASGQARVDPSRRPFFLNGIQMSDTKCHHFSYVRRDIDLKINNSSANLKKSRELIYKELKEAKSGRHCNLYNQPLQETENFFNLPLSW